MTFGDYIGQVKGEDPGAKQAINIFIKAKEKIFNKVSNRKLKNNNFNELRNYLKNVYFYSPSSNSNKGYEKLTNELIKAYNEYADEGLLDSVKLEDLTYNQSKTIAEEKLKKIRLDNNRNLDKVNITVRKMKEYLNKIDAIIAETSNINTLSSIAQRYEEFKSNYNLLLQSFEAATKEIYTGKTGKTIDIMVISKVRRKQNYNEEELHQMREGIEELRSIHNALASATNASPRVFGEALEYSLALTAQGVQEFREQFEQDMAQNLIQKVEKENLKGKTYTGSDGFNLQTHLSLNNKEWASFQSRTDKNQKEIGKTVTIGNITINYSDFLNTDSKRYAKTDVEVNFKDIPNSATYKISAKNWLNADSTKNDLGETSLLNAIHRTNGINVLDNYIYVLQHPQENIRTPGVLALQYAHEIAKISLLADIVMGYSQGNKSADTLIILDRARRDVYVLDILYELEQAIMFSKMLSSKNSMFIIDGYDEYTLQDSAISVRREIMKHLNWKNGQKSLNYSSFMKLYLNSIKCKIRVNRLLASTNKY